MARITCERCNQTETGSLEDVGDWKDRHQRKEQHYEFDIERATADGGRDEIPDDQTVYVAAKGLGGGSTVLHTDPDCRSVKSIRNVHERKRGMYPDDTQICGHCQGTTPAPTGGPNGHYRSLKDAAENDVAADGGSEQAQLAEDGPYGLDLSEGDQVQVRYQDREADQQLTVTGEIARTFAGLDDSRSVQRVIVQTDRAEYQIRWNGTVGYRPTPGRRWDDAGRQAAVERVAADGGDA